MNRDKNMVELYVDKDLVSIYKASLDLYEALKEVRLVWAGLDQYTKFPHLEEVITKALAKTSPSCNRD